MARKKRGDGEGKRGRARPAAVTAGHNLTVETCRERMLDILLKAGAMENLQMELRAATGAYRAEIKRAKAVGLDPAPIVYYIKNRLRPVEDLNHENGQINLIAMAMSWPIGVAIGVKGDGTSVAQAVDEAQLAEQDPNLPIDPDICYQDGYKASAAGKSSSTCQYAENSAQRIAWLQGWDQHQHEMASNIRPTLPLEADIHQHADETVVDEPAQDQVEDALDRMEEREERQSSYADMPF